MKFICNLEKDFFDRAESIHERKKILEEMMTPGRIILVDSPTDITSISFVNTEFYEDGAGI